MRARLGFTAVSLFVICTKHVPAQITASDSPKASFSMIISLKDEAVKPGSEVQVLVDLTNTSAGRISLWRSRTGPPPYMIRVLDRAAKTVQAKSPGAATQNEKPNMRDDKPPRAVVGTGSSVTLAPGETIKDAVSIENQFDLSQPGAYKIQFERPDPATNLLVRSNIVTLTVSN